MHDRAVISARSAHSLWLLPGGEACRPGRAQSVSGGGWPGARPGPASAALVGVCPRGRPPLPWWGVPPGPASAALVGCAPGAGLRCPGGVPPGGTRGLRLAACARSTEAPPPWRRSHRCHSPPRWVCPPLPAPPGPFQNPSAFVSWTAEQSTKGIPGCRFPDFYQVSLRTAPSGARCPRWRPGQCRSGRPVPSKQPCWASGRQEWPGEGQTG